MHMNLTDVVWTVGQALRLLAAAPVAWLVGVLAYLSVVEGLGLLPRVGGVLKLWAAAVGQAPVLVMAALVAAGQPLGAGTPAALGQALRLPWASQAVLVLGPLLGFGLGLLLLRRRAGPRALRFLFGPTPGDEPPAPGDLLAFRLAMRVAALPFVFVPAAVVLAGQGGLDGLRLGVSLAWAHPWALGAWGLASLMFERLSLRLSQRWPGRPGAVAAGLWLAGFQAFSFAWLYALSVLAVAR